MFEYGMNVHLNNLFMEVRRCAFSVLVDKGYTADKAEKAVNSINNFNVNETETGFRIEALVDDYKVIVFHHNDKIKVVFYGENKEEKEPEIINAEIKDEIKKIENIVYGLANTIDETTHEQRNIKENINVINGKLKFIGESLSADNRIL